MGFKCGIVGLPNVGKSTLFNALTASKNAEAANFPFCTIDPNIGIVDVVDKRLDNLSKLSKSKKKIYTNITFVDIAGLVKGASKGEGLGNKFLAHIREVDAIIHLVRCFESDKITHVNSEINPINDLTAIINKEVATAFFIGSFANITNAGIIRNPPPAPTTPVRIPITKPSIIIKEDYNFLVEVEFRILIKTTSH